MGKCQTCKYYKDDCCRYWGETPADETCHQYAENVQYNDLEQLTQLIQKELDNYIVKDTYTKGKNAGLRKALAFIQDIQGS